MKKLVIVYGSIAGAIVGLMLVVSFVFLMNSSAGFDPSNGLIVGFSSQFLAMSFIFIATYSYRKNVLGGVIKFGTALKIGLLISLIASTIYVLTWVILYHTSSSVHMDAMAQSEVDQLIKDNASQAKIDAVKERWAFYRTLPGLVLFTYVEILPTGILFSLISATVFSLMGRKKKVEAKQ